MAERNSLLNCRTGNGTEGSNPSLSAKKCCPPKRAAFFVSSVASLSSKKLGAKNAGSEVQRSGSISLLVPPLWINEINPKKPRIHQPLIIMTVPSSKPSGN